MRKDSVAYAGSDFSFFLLYQYFMASQAVSRVIELRHRDASPYIMMSLITVMHIR